MAKCYVFSPPAAGSASLATIYANSDGCSLPIPWSFDNFAASHGGWESSSGSTSAGYTFTNFDTVINNQLGFGATHVIPILQPISFGPTNFFTPNYVFTTAYATAIASPTGQLFTGASTGYPGAGTIPVNTCAQGVDNTAFPVAFQAPFVTAWKAAVIAAVNHIKAASYASKIPYIRVGGGGGGEWLPYSTVALETQCSPANVTGLTTAWLAYMSSIQAGIVAQASGLSFDQATNGGLPAPFNLPYSLADSEAALAVSSGFGIGDQGFQNYDIGVFGNFGTASGGSNFISYSSNDFLHNFAVGGAPFYQVQTYAFSDPTFPLNIIPPKNTMGSLVPLLPFGVARGATHFELYYKDWQVAYDPTSPNYGTYHTAYQTSIQSIRQPSPPTNPIGIVTGTFQTPAGVPVNGTAQFALSAEGVALTTACFAGSLVEFPVVNGALSASVAFNDMLIPSGSLYQVTVRDYNMGQIWNAKYQFIGGTANLNTMVPL